MRKIILTFVLVIGISHGLSEKERDKLLMLIQGLYKDRVYSLSAKKAEEYLKKTDSKDPYRDKVFFLQLQAYIKEKNESKILEAIDRVNNLGFSEDVKKRTYGIVLNYFERNPEKLEEAIKRIINYTEGYERDQLYKKLALLYYKNKKWAKILQLPDIKEINFLKVVSLYKMGRYMDVVKATEKMDKFLPDQKDDVLYYRALAFHKLGREDKAAANMESITFKTPEVVKFLANYYFKRKKYLQSEKYFKLLTYEEGFKDYGYYMLGVIEDQNKNYKKAAEYYKKAVKIKGKYSEFARKRLLQLKSAGVIEYKGDTVYSVRVILFMNENQAENFIRKYNLVGCFSKPFKKYIAVYCGTFPTKKDALKKKEELVKKGFKDVLIEKIKI
ncbi:tetratricopeptide repeat protein [Persephonella sp.]